MVNSQPAEYGLFQRRLQMGAPAAWDSVSPGELKMLEAPKEWCFRLEYGGLSAARGERPPKVQRHVETKRHT